MNNNKNNSQAMRYIKFTINTKKKYLELLNIIKNINGCDYYIGSESNKIFYIYAHFNSSYKICKKIYDLKINIENCKGYYDKVINDIKSNTVLIE